LNDLLAIGLDPVTRILIALGPILLLVGAFYLLDSHRLVSPRQLLQALLAGGVCAGAGFVLNNLLLRLSGLSLLAFAIMVAPVVEELLKAAFGAWLVRTGRVGFLIDAALLGFATGAGFALVENIYYLNMLARSDLLVWSVRGLGTAVMHGGTTAIFTVIYFGITRGRGDRRPGVAALAVAILLHGLFNRFLVHPLWTTAVAILVVPPLLAVAYRVGEHRLQNWLGTGMDRDLKLLRLIRSGEVGSSPLGRYLQELRSRLGPARAVDAFCLLRLQAELNLVVQGGLLLRQNGLKAELPAEVGEKMVESSRLQRSLGPTGRLALLQVSPWDGGHPWQLRKLEQWRQEIPS